MGRQGECAVSCRHRGDRRRGPNPFGHDYNDLPLEQLWDLIPFGLLDSNRSRDGIAWTVGSFDIVLVLEGSDEAATTALLKVGSLGNVRTQTLRGFSFDEMKRIIGNLP